MDKLFLLGTDRKTYVIDQEADKAAIVEEVRASLEDDIKVSIEAIVQ